MLTLLCGENDYELTKKVAQLKTDFVGQTERYDATDLTSERLADIFAGQSLFATERLVFIDAPSSYGELWQQLPAWAKRMNDQTTVVLIEPKPDKRTSGYKWLKAHATVLEFTAMDERDGRALTAWIEGYAAQNGVHLTAGQARRLADRVGAGQWELAHAIDKLALAGEVTDQWIDDVSQASPHENVFLLFEAVLNGNGERVTEMLRVLERTEDPYRLLGLLVSQVLQLLTLTYADGDSAKAAADTGAKSAYPFQKLAPFAKRMSKQQAVILAELFAVADTRLKQSDADPWTVLESTLTQSASVVNR